MTLQELFQIIRHYWYIIIFAVAACMAACFVYLVALPPSYSATAQLNLTGEPGSIGALARNAGADVDVKGTSFTVNTDNSSKTVSIVVSGSDEEACVEVANKLAEASTTKAKTMYENVKISVAKAETAISTSPSTVRYLLVALIAGLLIGLCLVVILDLMRASVKSAVGLEEATGLPVLATLPAADDGARLLANVRFAAKDGRLSTICVLPCGSRKTAPLTCMTISRALEAEGGVGASAGRAEAAGRKDATAPVPTAAAHVSPAGRVPHLLCHNSVADSIEGVYAANRADVTVVSVKRWSDSMRDLADTLKELELAKANVAGLVLVK